MKLFERLRAKRIARRKRRLVKGQRNRHKRGGALTPAEKLFGQLYDQAQKLARGGVGGGMPYQRWPGRTRRVHNGHPVTLWERDRKGKMKKVGVERP